MNDEQIIQFLQDNLDYMINNDIFLWLFRKLGWMLSKGLTGLIDITQELYNLTYALVDITVWTGLEDWINEFRPLIVTILFLSLVVLGFMFMFGQNRKHNLLTSILIFGAVVTASSTLLGTMNQGVIMFRDAVIGTEGVADGKALIKENLYDLLYIDKQIELKNMKDGNRPQYPDALTDQDMEGINITETVSWDDVDNADTKDILHKKLRYQVQGDSDLQDVSEGILSIGNEFYFRYKFNFWTYFLDALAILLIYFCLSYKNVRISYELFVGRLLVTLKSADLSTKKKVVKILLDIRDQYFALCFTAVTIRTYFFFREFINLITQSHGIVRGIVTLFLAFCVIDGSNMIQKFTGVDAGLSSVTGKLLAGSHMIQGVMTQRAMHRMSKGAGRGAVEKMGQFADKTTNAMAGGMNGTQNTGKSMDQDLTKNAQAKANGVDKDLSKNGAAGAATAAVKMGTDAAKKGMDAMDKGVAGVGNADSEKKEAMGTKGGKKVDGEDTHNSLNQMDAATGNAGAGENQIQGEATEQMNQDLGVSGIETGESMNQMDQDMEAGQRYGSTDSSQGSSTDKIPDNASMFQRWEEKGQDSFGGSTKTTKDSAMNRMDAMEKKSASGQFQAGNASSIRTEQSKGDSGTERERMSQPKKTSEVSGTKNHADDFGAEGHHPTRMSEETVGRDHYVGGVAVSKRGPGKWKKDSKNKKE